MELISPPLWINDACLGEPLGANAATQSAERRVPAGSAASLWCVVT